MQFIQGYFREAPNRTTQFDYGVRTDGQPDYIGHAPFGTSQSATGWTIFKYTYNGSNFVTQIESTVGKWSLRATYF